MTVSLSCIETLRAIPMYFVTDICTLHTSGMDLAGSGRLLARCHRPEELKMLLLHATLSWNAFRLRPSILYRRVSLHVHLT